MTKLRVLRERDGNYSEPSPETLGALRKRDSNAQNLLAMTSDILVITELWRNQSKYQTRRKQFIVSEPILIKKGPR